MTLDENVNAALIVLGAFLGGYTSQAISWLRQRKNVTEALRAHERKYHHSREVPIAGPEPKRDR